MFRDVARGIAKNTAVMLFQHIVTVASSILLMLFLPRYLGPVQYGWIFLATSITQIFTIFVSYGGNYFITKKVARSREQTAQILVDSTALRLAFAAVSIVAILIFDAIAGYSAEENVIILLFAIGLIWAGGQTVLYAAYQGHELMQYTSAGAIAARLFQTVTVLVAIWMGANVTVIAALMMLAGLTSFLVLLAYMKRIAVKLPKVNWQSAFKEIKEGLPYFLFAVFGVIYYRIDSVMLSKMSTEAVVGWYGGAYRLFETLNFPSIYTIAIYPVLSRLWKEEERTHQRTMQKSLELIIVGGVLITVGAIAFADKIIGIFYGLSAFGPSVLLLQILCAGLLFLYVDMILGTSLLSSDKHKQLMLVSLAAIPLNIALNYLIIPYYEVHNQNGAIGAAIATGLTEVCIMIACLRLLPKGVLQGFRWGVIPKSLTAGLGMSLFLWICSALAIQWVISGVLSVVVFFSLLWFLKTFEPSERAFLQGLFTVNGFRNAVHQLSRSMYGS